MKKRVLSEALMCVAIAVSLGACGGTAKESTNQEVSAVEMTAAPTTEAPVSETVTTQAPATEAPATEAPVAEKEQATGDTDSKTESEDDSDSATLVDGMRPDFKEAMDSYEAFYNEYCDFMKKYNENPSDLSLLMEYADMLTRSAEMSEKFEEWNSDDLNDAELKYYLEVNNRVMQKLAEVAY